jgi:O-antigen ligase
VSCTIGRDISILGFTVQGYAWFITLLCSLAILLQRVRKNTFPWMLWSPWLMVLLVYLPMSPFGNAFQRTIMMACPVIVGMAVSTYTTGEIEIRTFQVLIEKSTMVFFLFILVTTGLLFSGSLPEITGLAPQVITGSLLASLFIAIYAVEKKKSNIYYWAGLVAVPIIALTRMGIAATMITYPVSLAPVKMERRIVALVLIGLLGIGVFYTERVQRKMFYSGSGTFFDMNIENPDFRTTGRTYLWDRMNDEMIKSPWFGFGANANEQFIIRFVGIQGQPHNDFLRIRFDYGYLGLCSLLACFFAQTLHAWSKAKKSEKEARILFYAGASSFIPLLMFMYTDNIILYCQFFGNLQFTILGLAYAASQAEKPQEPKKPGASENSLHLPSVLRSSVPPRGATAASK